MTDNDLVKRLREPWYGGPSRRMAEELEAANRIEALTEPWCEFEALQSLLPQAAPA